VNQGEMIVSSIDFGGDKESVKKEWIVKRKKRTVLFYLFKKIIFIVYCFLSSRPITCEVPIQC
jgi:hypothetical protein